MLQLIEDGGELTGTILGHGVDIILSRRRGTILSNEGCELVVAIRYRAGSIAGGSSVRSSRTIVV